MKAKRWSLIYSFFVLYLAYTLQAAMAQPINAEQKAKQTLDAAGVKGGLIVHIGCGEGKLTAALCVNDSFLVHGLDTDSDSVLLPAPEHGQLEPLRCVADAGAGLAGGGPVPRPLL